MNVSVIIPTWNNCRRLRSTLEALGQCSIPSDVSWEVIVVDNNSSDDTRRIVERLADSMPLIYVHEPVQGISRAKNTGLNRASGELIVFTDDDISPNPDWLATYWNAYCQRPGNFIYCGPLQIHYESEPPADHHRSLAPGSVVGLSLGDHPRGLATNERFLEANWACPADVLRAVCGFDERLGLDASLGATRVGEGYELQERLRKQGYEAWYLPDNWVVHHVPTVKCRLPHIASRAEAQGQLLSHLAQMDGFFAERPNLKDYTLRRALGRESFLVSVDTSGPLLGGVPWRLFRHVGVLWMQWRLAQVMARRRAASTLYVSYRFCLGALKGFREAHRQPSVIPS